MANTFAVFSEARKFHTIEPFGYRVEIVYTTDIHGSGSKRGADIPERAYACHMDYESPRSTLLLPLDCDAGTVAHECYHCIYRVMERIGADHENEIMAYHIGDLVQVVHNFEPVARKRITPTPGRKKKLGQNGTTSAKRLDKSTGFRYS